MHTIRAAAWAGASPSGVLEQLNHAVLRSDRNTFCTALYCELFRTGAGFRLTVTAGGHPLPVRRGSDGTTRSLGRPGSLIGVLDVPELATTVHDVAADDTVILYTDGVTDLPPPYGLDVEDMHRMVERAGDDAASADEVALRFGDEIAAELPLSERNDDIALLVLRVD